MSGEIKGMKELKKAFVELGKLAEQNQRGALKQAALQYEADVKKAAPHDKGQYRASIRTEMVSASEAVVGTPLPQARIREYGGTIKAKNGPYLKFKINGKWVQVRMVHQTASPHFRPPLDQNWQEYQKTYLEALGRA